MKCKLTNILTNDTIEYEEAIFMKLNGEYGYLVVDLLSVKFFYTDMNMEINYMDLTDKYKIEYILT